MIPLSEAHLRGILKILVEHYNRRRPHSSLGPGVPGPPHAGVVNANPSNFRHRLEKGAYVRARLLLGRLHHEYYLAPPAI